MKDWIYNEFSHVGVDYSRKSNVDVYDDQMERFRNYQKEAEEFLARLGAPDTKDLIAVDIGCGTGAFSLHAAPFLRKIYAVDVSPEMLKTASSKAEDNRIENIEFCNSGFLTFQPQEKVDVIYTKWAFHHLPDYWKQVGLLNMNRMLKPGGVLFLTDVVFKFDPDYETGTEAFLKDLSTEFGEEFAEETKIHIKDEYSTYDWILQGLIERAGFSIETSNTEDCLVMEYFCRKAQSFKTDQSRR